MKVLLAFLLVFGCLNNVRADQTTQEKQLDRMFEELKNSNGGELTNSTICLGDALDSLDHKFLISKGNRLIGLNYSVPASTPAKTTKVIRIDLWYTGDSRVTYTCQ